MKSKPTVSVIIPMYNAENFIADCIESVFKQDIAVEKIICVDDHSIDNTAKIVHEFQKKYPELIHFIQLEKNCGAPHARNQGLKIAKGDYIQFLDADDFLLPDKLDHQSKLLEGLENKPDFIASAYLRRSLTGLERKIYISTENNWLSLLNAKLGCTCSNLWKREAVIAVGGFNENLKSSQEYGLMFDLLKNNAKISYDNVPLTLVRDSAQGKSISKKDPPKNWEQYVKLRIDTFEYLESHKLIQPNEQNFLLQPIFAGIRILYNFSPEKALALYREHIPISFFPIADGGISFFYCKSYSLLGFVMT